MSTYQEVAGARAMGKRTPPGFSSGGGAFVAKSERRVYWAGRVNR